MGSVGGWIKDDEDDVFIAGEELLTKGFDAKSPTLPQLGLKDRTIGHWGACSAAARRCDMYDVLCTSSATRPMG